MKQSCFWIFSTICAFILVELSDLKKTSAYGENLNTLSANPTTPSSYSFEEYTSSFIDDSPAPLVSDQSSTIETPHSDNVETPISDEVDALHSDTAETLQSDSVENSHSGNVDTSHSDDVDALHSGDAEKINASHSDDAEKMNASHSDDAEKHLVDVNISSSQSDEPTVRFSPSNDSSIQSTINAFLEQDEMPKSTTETIISDTQEPQLNYVQPRMLSSEETVTSNSIIMDEFTKENTPKSLIDTTSKTNTIVDENSTRGRRYLTPKSNYQITPPSNNLVDVLSTRLIELYVANVHSTEGLPSREVLTVLLSPLRVIIEQSVNLLGLNNCKLVCDSASQPIYLHAEASRDDPKIAGQGIGHSHILDVFSKLVNYHKKTSATKTPWLDLLRIISPIDCYKPENNNNKLEVLVNKLLNKYGYLHPKYPQPPMKVPLPIPFPPLRVKTLPQGPIPSWHSKQPVILPQYWTPKPPMGVPLWPPTVGKTGIGANYPGIPPNAGWPPMLNLQPSNPIRTESFPAQQVGPYTIPNIHIRPEITIPNINILSPWPGNSQDSIGRKPIKGLPFLNIPKMIHPFLNIWDIIGKLKGKGNILPSIHLFQKPRFPLPVPVIPMIPKLKPILSRPSIWNKGQSVNKWPLPTPFMPMMPPVRIPNINILPKKPSFGLNQGPKFPGIGSLLPSWFSKPKLLSPLKKKQNQFLQFLQTLFNKPKYPLPELNLPRGPSMDIIKPRPGNIALPMLKPLYNKPSPPFVSKISSLLGMLKPCSLTKSPVGKPRLPLPGPMIPLFPTLNPALHRPNFSGIKKKNPLLKILNLVKLPKLVAGIGLLPKLSLLKPKHSYGAYPLPQMHLPQLPQISVSKPNIMIKTGGGPSLFGKVKPFILPALWNKIKPVLIKLKPALIPAFLAKLKPAIIPALLGKFPIPQIHINVPNINIKPIYRPPTFSKPTMPTPWVIPNLSQFKKPLRQIYAGLKPWLATWKKVKMPSMHLPPLNIPKLQPINKLNLPPKLHIPLPTVAKPDLPPMHVTSVHIPSTHLPSIHITPSLSPLLHLPPLHMQKITKFGDRPCKTHPISHGHTYFPLLQKPKPFNFNLGGGFGGLISKVFNKPKLYNPLPSTLNIHKYTPLPSMNQSPTMFHSGINIGIKPTISLPLKTAPSTIHQMYTPSQMDSTLPAASNQQLIKKPPMILYEKPVVAPTNIPMVTQPVINNNPIVLVSKPGVSTTSIDKDGNLVGKLKINANGKPCIELDHPALQMIAEHEKSSLRGGGGKQGWFELWYNDGTGPEKRRWKLVWNNKEIQDFLRRKNNSNN